MQACQQAANGSGRHCPPAGSLSTVTRPSAGRHPRTAAL